MGGFLTIGYCFPEIFWGDMAFDGGGQSRDGVPPSPPTRENPDWCCQYVHSPLNITIFKHFTYR